MLMTQLMFLNNYSLSWCYRPGTRDLVAGHVCYCLQTYILSLSLSLSLCCRAGGGTWQPAHRTARLPDCHHVVRRQPWQTLLPRTVTGWHQLQSSSPVSSDIRQSLQRTFPVACLELFWFWSGLFVYLSWGRSGDQGRVSAALINTTFFSHTEITGVSWRERKIYK